MALWRVGASSEVPVKLKQFDGDLLLFNDLDGGWYTSSARLNNGFWFAGNDGVTGLEPWITDGSTGGTRIIKDINVGGWSSLDD